MPPKFDPTAVQTIFVRVRGGKVGNPASLAPKVGPLGLSPKKVGEDIAKATGDWKDLRITVKLEIQNRQTKIEVVPSAASLIIKALNEPSREGKAKGEHTKHNGNISMEDIHSIAKLMRGRSMSKDYIGTVKEIIGSCVSVGCTIDGETAKVLLTKIRSGEVELENRE
eukprot:TRINITY_DN111_c0_g1_i1.p1 TRINITY_DN111_c0_g1~~TRINITY_DN111_c0_g1_i1.p1  ORF type:complete len:168 (-),score=31.22 TRINITY_DN111_c0_g1_i1:25-528(-)